MNALLLKNLNALCIRSSLSGLLGANGANSKRSLNDQATATAAAAAATTTTSRSAEDVKQYLKASGIKNYDGWNSLLLYDYCKAPSSSLYVDQKTGDFFCLKCRVNGDWSKFKELDEAESLCRLDAKAQAKEDRTDDQETALEKLAFHREWKEAKAVQFVSFREYQILLKNLKINFELSKKLLETLDIRIAGKKLLYPVYDYTRGRLGADGKPSYQLTKILSLVDTEADENEPVFGLQSVFADLESNKRESSESDARRQRRLFVTDSLINLLILNGVCKGPAICVPSVDALDDAKSYLVKALLENYDQIIFWQKDKNLSFQIANELNINRCFMVNYARSPHECLSLNENVLKIVKDEVFSMQLSSVLKFDSIKREIFEDIVNKDKMTGVKWKRFGPLNNYMKGFRAGELTIFTGTTGCGKTTFLSEYSLDLAIQGVRTLWGSFEIRNKRLVKTMMKQFSRLNLDENANLFDNIAHEYAKLPLYFMDFHSEQTIENVIRTMSNSVLLYGVQHVIIDNLQFMVGNQFAFNIDKFTQQDIIMSKFRQFATNFNCHVTLVIHPRKEEVNEPLKITSVFGSAKSTQEADNVLILQQEAKEVNNKKLTIRYIEICKNRYDGELGRMVIKFNKDSQNYSPVEFIKVVDLDQAHRYQ